jgi:hypothetical protein
MDSQVFKPISASTIDKTPWWNPTISKIELFFGEKPFFSAFLVAGFLFTPILVLFRLYFQWADDYYAVLLLKGIGLSWTPSELNYQENTLLCLALKNLYLQFPQVEWYSCLFVLTHFLTAWAILAAFNLGTNRFFKSLLFILGSVVLEAHFLIQLQWTVVAAAAAVGAFLLLAAIWKEQPTKFLRPALSLVFVLMMISILIRPLSLLLIVVASFPASVYLGWKAEVTSTRRKILAFLAITTALSLGAVAFDRHAYFQDKAWGDSLGIIQECRQSIFRNVVFNQTTKPFFDSIGWTMNDRNLFCYNYFMDPDTYSVEKLQKLNDYFPRFTLDKNSQDTFAAMFSNPGFLAAFVFFLAALPFLAGENFWFILADEVWTGLVLCFCRLYLWMPERIYIPCLFLLNSLVIFFALSKTKGSFENSRKLSRAFKWGIAFQVVYLLFTVRLLQIHYFADRSWNYEETKLKTAVQTLNPQDDQVFVTWGSAFPYNKISAFDNDEFLRHFHIISLDWFQRSPMTSAMMNHYGLKNIFKDLVDNPKVFLICTPNEWLLYRIYMKEKYNKDVNGKIDYQSDQFTVLSVHSS